MTPAVIQAWPGVVHQPVTTPFTTSGTYTIPSWANYLDIVMVGAGGGGGSGDGLNGLTGAGGAAGYWTVETLSRAYFPTSGVVTVTPGTGGSGSGSGNGATGGSSTASGTGMSTVSSPGGAGGASATGTSNTGIGPGDFSWHGITYPGGSNVVGGGGIPGSSPGGGGSGGDTGNTTWGGNGANGEVWMVARQAATAYDLYYDGIGAGTQNKGASWLHSAIGGNCLIGVLSAYSGTHLASQTFTMKCGTTSMNLLKSVEFKTAASPFAYALMFGLMNPPTGDQTISWTSTVGQTGLGGNTVSLKGISGLGTAVSATGSSTGGSLTQAVTSAAGKLIIHAFTDSTTGGDIVEYSPSPVWYGSGAASASALTIGDAAWAPTVNFAGQGWGGSGSVWAGLAVPLL